MRSRILGTLAILGLAPWAFAQQTEARPAGAPAATQSDDVAAMRDGKMVGVVRLAERLPLELDLVDLNADPVLVVDGVPVTQGQLRETLCLMAGTNEIDQFVTYLLSLQLQKQYGLAAPSVSDEEVAAALEQQKAMAQQMGGMDPAEMERQIREEFGWDRYVEFQKIQLGFEKLFLPDPPEGFMEAQAAKFAVMQGDWQKAHAQWKADNERLRRKAIEEGRQPKDAEIPAPVVPVPDGDLSWLPAWTLDLLEDDFGTVLKENYARGQEMHPMLRRGLINTLKVTLVEGAQIDFAGQGPAPLADGVLFTVDGEPVRMETIHALIRSRIDDSTRRLALREILALRAADKALAARGYLETPEQSAERYEKMAAQYAGSLIPLAQAIMLRGFPNEHHYRRYFQRKAAYRNLIEKTTPEEELRDHYEKAGRLFFEGGAVTGQVLFIPGEDREKTLAEAEAALARVRDGESFRAVALEVGRFPPNRDSKDGAFNDLVRNRLRMFLRESEYTSFVLGYSLTDDLFYTASAGQFRGPFYREATPGMQGAIAVLASSFRSSGLRRTFEEARDSAVEDLSDLTFPAFVNEALATLSIELPATDGEGESGQR